jgi:ATP:ADP antiporter, AAA family
LFIPPRAGTWFRMRRPGSELRASIVGCAGFFFLLTAISLLRPVRDQAAIATGTAALPRMFGGTFVTVLAGVVLVTWMAARVSRSRYVTLAYRTFAIGLLLVWMPLRAAAPWAADALFVWSSACSLLAVSLYWAALTDLFDRAPATRRFGMIAAGATAGTLAGPLLVQWLALRIGPANLLPIAAVLLELAVQVARALRRMAPASHGTAPAAFSIRQSLAEVVRSNLLRRLSGYVLLLTATATLLYLEQARLVSRASGDAGERTVLFARIDLAVNAITFAFQACVARQLLESAGVRLALAALPLVTAAGFLALVQAPSLLVLALAQGLRKAAHFAFERPGREALLTALEPGQKYAPKAFVDTVVYRGGDALSAWLSQALPPAALAPAALALCAVWLLNSLLLARGGETGKGMAG